MNGVVQNMPEFPQGEGGSSWLECSPPLCGRGLGGGGVSARPRQCRTAPGVRPGGLRLRRRIGGVGQDQAADRSAAAPDAGRRGARAHPVPHLHQGRRRGDGGAAAEDARRLGHAGRRGAGATNCARSRSQPSDQTLRGARALFARVLDLPGGMRIGTIHAFCQSLLRRFPLEASLSPHFRLVDDRDAEDALTEARENHAGACQRADDARGAGYAGRASHRPISSARHVATLQGDLPRLREALALGDGAGGRRSAARSASPPPTEAEIIAARGELAGGTRAARGGADRAATGRDDMRRTRGRDPRLAQRSMPPSAAEHWPHWCEEFLTKEGKPRAPSGFASKAVTDAHPDLARAFPRRMRPRPRGDRRRAWR